MFTTTKWLVWDKPVGAAQRKFGMTASMVSDTGDGDISAMYLQLVGYTT